MSNEDNSQNTNTDIATASSVRFLLNTDGKSLIRFWENTTIMTPSALRHLSQCASERHVRVFYLPDTEKKGSLRVTPQCTRRLKRARLVR